MSTLERIRAGDAGALEELLQACWAPLVRHLTPLLGGREGAEDAAQEAFVRLWEHRERWTKGSARGLLYRMGRNAALDQTRRRNVRDRWTEAVAPTERSTTPAPDETLERTALHARLEAALAALPDRRREVFELVRFAGLSYREVAEALDLSPQTVANHMSLALRDLREDLADLATSRGGEEPEARSHDG